MSSQDDIQSKLRAGVEAARSGDRVTARRLLEEVIDIDENNEMAWIWLASSVNSVAERRACLERVLQINPGNTRAKEALQRLTQDAAPAVSQSDTADQARLRQQISQVRRIQGEADLRAAEAEGSEGIGLSSLAILGLLVVAVLGTGFIILNIVNRNNTPVVTPTQVVAVATATDAPTETAIPSITVTPRGLSVDEVTRVLAPTLPPTFTATYTPTATKTLFPSATPIALESYPMLYISLNEGAGITEPDVYTINADKSNEGQRFNRAQDVEYDKTGNQLVFIRDVETDGVTAPEVFIASDQEGLDGGKPLTALRAPDTAHPSFSADGSLIIFSSTGGSNSKELWLMNADGTNLHQLTNNSVVDRDPSFSPVDNALIVFTSDIDSPGLTEI
ncbi:MAG TPA: hypothetical protein VHL11_16225, partial [Phototrophicaceae bacterium]|nr:hypothetical protein [Phototrophicaceae bacterium]